MSTGTGDKANRPQARCVLWHAPGADVPADLRGALSRRSVATVECDTALWAMAELCRLHHLEPAEPLILLLLEPRLLGDVREAVRVAERYAPHATHWVYDSTREPRLRAYASAGTAAGVEAEGEDALRIAGMNESETESSDNADAICEAGESQPSILTQQELASLKHPDQVGDSEA